MNCLNQRMALFATRVTRAKKWTKQFFYQQISQRVCPLSYQSSPSEDHHYSRAGKLESRCDVDVTELGSGLGGIASTGNHESDMAVGGHLYFDGS